MSKGVRATLSKATVAVVAVLALLLAGCGGGGSTSDSSGSGGGSEETPQPGGTLNVAQVNEAETLDPAIAADTGSINTLSQIMEPLYLTSPDGEIKPWLATSAKTSKDELTWDFELRKGIKFSDGKPMTADDVVFSLESAKKSPNWAPLFEAFETVKATSPSTLQIKVAHPLPAMEALLSSYATVVMPDNYGGLTAEEFGQEPIGTGPFALESWKHGQSMTLAANPNYWDKGKPYVEKLVLKGVPDDNSRVSQLKGGQLDVIAAPPLQQIAGLEGDPSVAVGEYALAFSRYILINAEKPAFKDPRLREAVNLAIDRDGIVETALAGHGETGGAFLAPAVPFHDDGIETPARDIEKAKQLVAEAEKDGADPSFTLLSEAGVSYGNLASQIIQQDLEEIGFTVKLQPLDTSALLEAMGDGNFEAGLLGLYPNVLDPSENTYFYIATEGLFTKSDTTKLSALAEEGSSTSAPAERERIYDQIQEEVDKANYTITIGYEPWIWATNEEVAGFDVNPLDIPWFADVGFSG